MRKKLLPLAFLAGAAGIAFTASKIIANRKKQKLNAEWNDISNEFYEAWSQKENGVISEKEYRERLNEFYCKSAARGVTAINDLLEEAYFEAEYAADCHAALMADVDETDAISLEDFIKRFPDKAYGNGVLGLNEYCNDDQVSETADYMAEKYYQGLNKTESQLFEYVEMLGGDTRKITQEFDKIRGNSIY